MDEEEEDEEEEEEEEQNVVEQRKNVVEQHPNVVEQQVGNGNGLQDVYDLERRISDIEIIFQQLKEMKERKERGESRGETSGLNQLVLKGKK